mmetsp:Transcript_94672/g.216562  ORF Transcript_94672/g.216562 Transcript_94672/m.216562 type:complete len:274 (-) Transcript_94672:651-1472(-)
MWLSVLAIAAVVHEDDTVVVGGVAMCRSPGGLHPCDCLHTVESGTRVEELADSNGSRRIRLHHPNGTVTDMPQCVHPTPPRPGPPSNGSQGRQWPGLKVGDFDDPCELGWGHAAPMEASFIHSLDVAEFSAVYSLPPSPSERGKNILYYWIGLQDTTSTANPVIQPVLAYDGSWYAESWNCCPAGHKLKANSVRISDPGDTVTASIQRDESGVYTITSTVGDQSSVLSSDDTNSGLVTTWGHRDSEHSEGRIRRLHHHLDGGRSVKCPVVGRH